MVVITGEVMLACSEYKPGTLLNILPHAGQPPQERYPVRNVNSAEAEIAGLRNVSTGDVNEAQYAPCSNRKERHAPGETSLRCLS